MSTINNKNEQLKARLKKRISELSASSSIHGYSNLFRAYHLATKIMWFLSFLLSTGLCGFMVYRIMTEYLSYNVITEIKDFHEIPTYFPKITLCNMNPLITSFAAGLVKDNLTTDGYDISYLNETYLSSLNASQDYITQKFEETYSELQKIKVGLLNQAMNPSFGDRNRKKLGYELDEVLIKCIYNQKKCTSSHFDWFYIYEHGNCFRFNSGYDQTRNTFEPLKSVKHGNEHGLYLELYVGDNRSLYSFNIASGYVLFINNQTVNPASSESISLKPDTLTNIAIAKVFKDRQPRPYSKCEDLTSSSFNRLLYNAIVSSNVTYRQKDCFDLCLQKMVIEECGCYDLKYSGLFNSLPCLNATQTSCSDRTYDRFIDYHEIDNVCQEFCPLECESVVYAHSMSLASFPTEKYAELLVNNPAILKQYPNRTTKQVIMENTLAVNVYYEDLKYTLISETPKMSIFDLVANTGGTLGLFIGVSLLSFVEIVEILLEFIIILCENSAKSNKKVKHFLN
jgi:hypothetical protein